jgi:hypothetical protein
MYPILGTYYFLSSLNSHSIYKFIYLSCFTNFYTVMRQLLVHHLRDKRRMITGNNAFT